LAQQRHEELARYLQDGDLIEARLDIDDPRRFDVDDPQTEWFDVSVREGQIFLRPRS
jgi:hypothetical protein